LPSRNSSDAKTAALLLLAKLLAICGTEIELPDPSHVVAGYKYGS